MSVEALFLLLFLRDDEKQSWRSKSVEAGTGETKTVYNFHDEKNIVPGIYFVRVMQDGEYSRALKIIKK